MEIAISEWNPLGLLVVVAVLSKEHSEQFDSARALVVEIDVLDINDQFFAGNHRFHEISLETNKLPKRLLNLPAKRLSIEVSNGVKLGLIPHIFGKELYDWFLSSVGGSKHHYCVIIHKRKLTYIVESVRFFIVYSDTLRIRYHNFLKELVCLKWITLNARVAAETVSYNAFLGNTKTALGS